MNRKNDVSRMNGMNRKVDTKSICITALAVCINIVGGELALALRLPIYLDSVGTILTGILLGPIYGMAPNLISGIVMGMTTDIYSLYFAPVGMITGFMAGLMAFLFRGKIQAKKGYIFLAAAVVTIPGTIVSSLICAGVFGGITSSGSTVLVQLLSHTPLGMTASVFVVQILTDYLDRLISLFLAGAMASVLPGDLKRSWKKQKKDGKGAENHGSTGGTIQ